MSARVWTVNKPGPLTQRAPNVWTVDDDIPGPLAGVNRRMTVIRRADGSLLFFNAIPVPDETLRALRELGTPRALVVPNQFHALDAAAFVEKLQLDAFMPDVAVSALKGRAISELLSGDDVQHFTVDGFSTREVVLVAHGCLIVGDLVTNVAPLPGFKGLMLRVVGFTGAQPRLPPPVRRRVGRDLKAVSTFLERLAAMPLTTLIPSHGEVFTGDVGAALRRVAHGLH